MPLIPSVCIQHDTEAHWAGHRRREPVHGYKAHVATDQDAVLIDAVEITTANVHDAALLAAVLPSDPGDVYGDSAFASSKSECLIIAHGGKPRMVRTGVRGVTEVVDDIVAGSEHAV